MKILIIGVIQSANFGDPVLTECVHRLVQEKAPEAEILLADLGSGEVEKGLPDKAVKESGLTVEKLRRRRLRYHLRKMITRSGICDPEYRKQYRGLQEALPSMRSMVAENPDLVIFAGGQVLWNRYGLQVAAILDLLQQKQIPAVLTSCGTGPDFSSRIMKELKRALDLPTVRFISVRDGWEKVTRWGIHHKIYDSADAALWVSTLYRRELSDLQAPPVREESGRSVTEQRSQKPVGIGVIFSMSVPVDREIRYLVRLTSFLNSRKIPWQFFGNGSSEDLCVAEYALQKCVPSEKERESHMAPWPEKPVDLIRLEAQFRGIISFRLHSHIIAASLGIPSVAIRWNDKLPYFFSKIGAPDRCLEIDEKPSCIWQAFVRAEQEGYDTQRLDEQRTLVENLLEKAVKTVR